MRNMKSYWFDIYNMVINRDRLFKKFKNDLFSLYKTQYTIRTILARVTSSILHNNIH